MTCPACGSTNPDAARFCAMCAAPLTTACRVCGTELLPGSRFCHHCGASLSERPPGAAAIPLAERRPVSVLFIDLVDFTTLAETADPEDVRHVQARYFEVARSVVAAHGGTIEKFIGDAVMAVWGAPTAHEDDPERAVRAALALIDAVARIPIGSGRGLRARAAITTGEAAVTIGATDQGMVSGDLVNVAARLQARAPVGGLVVDEATRDRAPSAARYEALGKMSLKGRRSRQAVYRASAGAPARTFAGAHAGTFVGRERELGELTAIMRSVISERHGRLVSITGIAGIGKSRLVWELGEWIEALEEPIAWHDGRSPAYGEGIAFAAVAEMVRRRIHVEDDAGPEIIRRQLALALAEYVPDDGERSWVEPRLAALLLSEPEAGHDRDELFAAWRRLFERIADRMPVVLVFEDLQWADAGLVAFIEHLATWTRARPILIVTCARPEFIDNHPGWEAGMARSTAIHLEGLDDDAMRRLLTERAAALSPEGVALVLRRAGGIPLYAVEVARALAQGADASRRVEADDAGEHRDEDGRSVPVALPGSLHALILSRIDAVPTAERRLLLAASVLGQRFPADALLAIVGDETSEVRGRIEALLRRELLTLDEDFNSPGRGDLGFVQELVREVAYRTLSRAQRRSLHLAAARYLDSVGDAVTEPLAGHLVAAHELTSNEHERRRLEARAVAALRHAARRAMALHAPARALALLQQALSLTSAATTRLPILDESADAARAAGELDVAEAQLREMVAIQSAARRRDEVSHTKARLASVLVSAQRNETAMQELDRAMRGLRGWSRSRSGVEIAAQLARAKLVTGDDAGARDWADEALAAAAQLDLPTLAIDLLVTRGTARLSLSEESAGLADLRDAIAQARSTAALSTELRARNNLAWYQLSDSPRDALETARRGYELATSMGVGEAATPMADILVTSAVETGHWAEAASVIDELDTHGLPDAYRILFRASASLIRTFRGEPDPLAPLTSLGELSPDTDSQVLAATQHARAWERLLAGELEEARRLADTAAAGGAGSDPAYLRATAVRASLWLGDAAGAGARLDGLRENRRGRAGDATIATMEAGLVALTRSARAPAAYRQALRDWQRLELPLQRTLCLLDRYRILGGASEELDEELLRLGAEGLRRLTEGTTTARR